MSKPRNGSAARRQRRRLIHLYVVQGGRCYWCNTPMLLPGSWKVDGKPKPNNLSTFDHLYHKYDPRRMEDNWYVGVAACDKCNQMRGVADMRKYGDK